MLIDIHTHIPEHDPANLRFLVGTHSLGLHPWELLAHENEAQLKKRFLDLKNKFHQGILAIGECGVDRARTGIVAVELQLKVLEWHLDWAQETNRPVILHNVRAGSDLLMLLKKKNYSGKILFHDFNGSAEEVQQVLAFKAWFSFGASLYRAHSKTPSLLQLLPREKIFLETDDQKEISLETLYNKACELWQLDQVSVEKIFLENLQTFFGDLDNISSTDLIAYLR